MAVAEAIAAVRTDRPLTLVRCVDGTSKPWLIRSTRTERLTQRLWERFGCRKKTGKPEPYITLSTSKALVELAQIGVLKCTPWGLAQPDAGEPDQNFSISIRIAQLTGRRLPAPPIEVRERLKKSGPESFLKTTGGNGLHVVPPIRAEHAWPDGGREFAPQPCAGHGERQSAALITR